MLFTADGNWYYWNGLSWTSGGIYQATETDEFKATNIIKNGNFPALQAGHQALQLIQRATTH